MRGLLSSGVSELAADLFSGWPEGSVAGGTTLAVPSVEDVFRLLGRLADAALSQRV
jgi:hypothetical protein